MALDGRGIAWLPRTLIEEDLEAGRLVVAAQPRWSMELEIRLYRQQAEVGRAAQAFWRAATGSGLVARTGQE